MISKPSAPVLSIRNLSVHLPVGADRPYAVQDLTLDVFSNEIVCIVGESGSGKSITSFATMGLLPKALVPAGEVLLSAQDVLKMKERQLARLRGKKVAMIFQEPMTSLNPCYTVGDQIEEVFAVHSNLTAAARRERTLKLLEEVRLPDPAAIYSSFPHQLSGGQRQRIMIAMALALDPQVLIADEPTTALDVTTQAQILKLFNDLKTRRNAAIIFVTHDFDVVAEIADRVVVMQHGQIVEQGTADEILNRPRHPYTRQLIDAVPRRKRVARSQELAPDRKDAIVVTGLEKTYSRKASIFAAKRIVRAVQPLDFAIRRGETLGIVGESGSGKSTLVKCLMRLETPDNGSVIVDGVDLAKLTKRELRPHRKDIQIVFQDPYASLNPRRTIGDQMIEGPSNYGERKELARERAQELLALVKMQPDAMNRYPSQFSGGQRQRLCIARALMMRPKILIADEAVSALDVSVQKEVLKLLADIKAQMGLTMIFITHDLRVAAQVSDELIVMRSGEVVERGPVEEVFGSPKHDYTKQLIDSVPGKDWEVPENLALSDA